MQPSNWSRRGFLQHSMGALTLSAGLPLWFAREILADDEEKRAKEAKKVSANDRIVMGAIGTGSRGESILSEAKKKGAEFVAVCDVDIRHRKAGISKAG